MKSDVKSPTLTQDAGAIAGIYRNVAWMLAQRVIHGPGWQDRLTDEEYRDAQRLSARETPADPRPPEPATPHRTRAA